jgi:hypothetical protein
MIETVPDKPLFPFPGATELHGAQRTNGVQHNMFLCVQHGLQVELDLPVVRESANKRCRQMLRLPVQNHHKTTDCE